MKNLFNFIQHITVKKYNCDNKNTNTEKVLKHINLKQNLKKPTVQQQFDFFSSLKATNCFSHLSNQNPKFGCLKI